MYLVYQHKKKTNNEIFYIGISANLSRPNSKSGRNLRWKQIVNKHDYYSEVILTGLTVEDACFIEKALILRHGRLTIRTGKLCNISDGGDGAGGINVIKHDLTGRIFGELLVISHYGGGKNSSWNCKCSCGASVVIPYPNLISGNTKKCKGAVHKIR